MDAVHAAVFPFDGEGAGVADIVEGDDDFLEVDVSMANGAEVPIAAWVREVGMTSKNAYGPVAMTPPYVFHVNVEDAIGEVAEEFYVVDSLVTQVGGVIIEAEALVVFNRCQCSVGGSDVEGDFRGMDFQGEIDIHLVEGIEDGDPAFGKVLVALLVMSLCGGWECVEQVPDAGAGEAVYDGGSFLGFLFTGLGVEEFTSGLCGADHFAGRALAHAFRGAVAPYFG